MQLGISSEQILRYIKGVTLEFHSKNIRRYPVLKCVNTFPDILYTLHGPGTMDCRQQKKQRNMQSQVIKYDITQVKHN